MRSLKHIVWIAVICATPCAADEIPQRKAGLWESTTTHNGKTFTIRQCVGDEPDPLLKSMLAISHSLCPKAILAKTSDGYRSEYSCQMGQVFIEGKGVITGDMNSAYKIESTSVTKGLPGKPEPVTRVISGTARRLGACEPGQSPGDRILPDGRVIHMPRRSGQRPPTGQD